MLVLSRVHDRRASPDQIDISFPDSTHECSCCQTKSLQSGRVNQLDSLWESPEMPGRRRFRTIPGKTERLVLTILRKKRSITSSRLTSTPNILPTLRTSRDNKTYPLGFSRRPEAIKSEPVRQASMEATHQCGAPRLDAAV